MSATCVIDQCVFDPGQTFVDLFDQGGEPVRDGFHQGFMPLGGGFLSALVVGDQLLQVAGNLSIGHARSVGAACCYGEEVTA